MAIQFIDNQSIYFTGDQPSASECKASYGCNDYCAPVEVADGVSFQFKQTPCDSTNLFCNPTLENTNTELVTNGDFASSAGWTFGTGWIYSSGYQNATRTSSVSGSLSRTLSLTPGAYYIVSFDYFQFPTSNPSPLTVSLGGTAYGNTFNSSGTYYITIQAGAGSTISFTTATALASIDNVSVKLSIVADTSGYCLYSSNPGAWVQNIPGKISHMSGDNSSLFTDITPTLTSGYFKITLKVDQMVGGLLSLKWYNITPTVFATVETNGVYTFYFNYSLAPGTTSFAVEFASADFIGTISDIVIQDLSITYPIRLESITGGANYNLATAGNVTYNNEYVTVNYTNSGILPDQYKVYIYDLCGSLVNADMIYDWDFASCDWTLPGASTCTPTTRIDILGVANTYIYDFYPNNWDTTFLNFISGSFTFHIKIEAWDTAQSSLELYDRHTNLTMAVLIQNVQSGTTYDFDKTLFGDPGHLDPAFRIRCYNNPTTGSHHEIGYLMVRENVSYPNQGNLYESNCLDIRAHHKCTHLIKGSCDQIAFGFDFTNFKIKGRVKSMFLNPKYKGDFNRYADANGKFTVTRSSSNKIYEFLIDYAPERAHDWLRLAVACDTIEIGTTNSTLNQWVNTQGDYQPEWPDTLGNFPLAQTRLELQRKIDELYNNNAG